MAISTLKVEAGLIPSIQKIQLKFYIHFALLLETEQANEKKWLSHSFYLRFTFQQMTHFTAMLKRNVAVYCQGSVKNYHVYPSEM